MSRYDSTMTMGEPVGRLDPFFTTIGPGLHAAFRIGVALLFMQHGAQKLFGWLGGVDGEGGTAALASLMGIAGVLEFFGGLLILIGLFTRPVAFLLMGEMAVAYAMAHLPEGWVPIQNQGELALLYALSFAFLFGNGAGPLSVDGAIARRRAVTAVGPMEPRETLEPTPKAPDQPWRPQPKPDRAAWPSTRRAPGEHRNP